MNIREKLREVKEFIIYNWIFIKSKSIRKKYKQLNVLDDSETVAKIIKEKKSISRFGDGEFCYILDINGTPRYQERTEELKLRLKEVLTKPNANVLTCIPRCMIYNKNMLIGGKTFWCGFTYKHGEEIYKLLTPKRVYGNTNFSRFYIDLKNKKEAKQKIERIKSIWNKKNITIVEGSKSKLGVGNDLFDNCNSLKRIICPTTNAFTKYNEILTTIENLVPKDDLILIALGPTATILAYDLAEKGYQALDIGHIDIEYEWYLKNSKYKIPIKGKMVNEVSDKSLENINVNDNNYENSIIAEIET